jgi:hypothetical protein
VCVCVCVGGWVWVGGLVDCARPSDVMITSLEQEKCALQASLQDLQSQVDGISSLVEARDARLHELADEKQQLMRDVKTSQHLLEQTQEKAKTKELQLGTVIEQQAAAQEEVRA